MPRRTSSPVFLLVVTVVAVSVVALLQQLSATGVSPSTSLVKRPSSTEKSTVPNTLETRRTEANNVVHQQHKSMSKIHWTDLDQRPMVERHQPRHVKEALREYEASGNKPNSGAGKDNTVPIDAEDVARSRASYIEPLPELPPGDGDEVRRSIWNNIKDFMQFIQVDASPIIADFGCTLGGITARQHPKATVLCLSDHQSTAAGARREHQHKTLKNEFPVAVTSFTTGDVLNLYRTCNFFSTSFILHGVLGGEAACDDTVALLKKVVPMSKSTFVAVAESCGDALVTGVRELDVKTEVTAIARVDAEKVTQVYQIRLAGGSRNCAKTWGAPEEQWDRKLQMRYEEGKVSFTVIGKADLARVIHPLQYIPSINLDTMLGMGLEVGLRERLLGQMIATPRYSDPLPHNWVLSGGGVVARIDKVDLRYDRKVDESKGYWGRSTRGYLHLLGYHLCLDIDRLGLPSVLLTESCALNCKACAGECSYLPKATTPCDQCVRCGECVGNHGEEAISAVDFVVRPQPKCQKSYNSMDAARKVWKKWEKADKSQPL